MNKETLDLLDKAIKEKCIFGLEKCKTKDWTFEVNNNSLECINTTGDKIEFELLDKSGDFIKYRTYLKPVEDHSHVGSIIINKKRRFIIKDEVYNLFKDIGVALDGINKLLDDYNGFEDVLEITKKKLEEELYPYAVVVIESTRDVKELMDTVEYFCKNEYEMEKVMFATWEILNEILEKDCDYEILGYILELRSNEKKYNKLGGYYE